MLETYANFLGTIQSIGWLLGGIFCSGLGFLFILDQIIMVRKSWLLSGVISDVMTGRGDGSSIIYYPVISFQDPLGTTHKIKSDFGTNRLEGKERGTKVRLYFRPDKPENIRLKNPVWFYFSLVFFLIGFILSHFYLAAMNRGDLSMMIAAVSVLLLLSGFLVRPRSGSFTQRQEKHTVSDDAFLSLGEHASRLSRERQGVRKSAPLQLIIAAVLIVAGVYTGKTQGQMALTYTQATGKIVTHELSQRDHSGQRDYYYYPVVVFTTDTGETVRFQDTQGASAPAYTKDQSVVVHYDPATPRKATIDRGLEDWIWPFLMLISGLIIGFFGLKALFQKIRNGP